MEEDDKSDVAVIYSRVSSQDQKQKGDLDRQKLRNMEYCVANGLQILTAYEECSSGFNDNRKKLQAVIKLASEGKFKKLVVEQKERLTRFNFHMFEYFLKQFGVEVVCVEQSLDQTFEAVLVEDIIHIMAVYSAKLYGKRSHKHKSKVM